MGHPRRFCTRPAIAALAAVSLSVLATAPAGAQTADTPGAGSSNGGTTLLHLRLGDGALDVSIGTEQSVTTNDTTTAPASALDRVIPLSISSTLVPALSALSTPPIEVSSDGQEKSVSSPTVDLGSTTAASPVPGLLGGTLQPLSLRAVVDALGSIADATGGASDVSVLGGVLQLGDLSALLGSDALVDGASAGRNLSLDHLDLLDLGGLLQLLGIGIDDLPIGVAAGLLQQLGLPLPGGLGSVDALLAQVQTLLTQAGSVPAQLDALGDQLVALQAQLADATAQLAPLLPNLGCDPLLAIPILGSLTCSQLQSLAASLQSTIDSLNAQIASLTAQIDALLDTVAAALDPLLAIVDGLVQSLESAPLVSVENLSLGVVADAVETLEASKAEVTGSLGSIRIGNLPPIANADLLALADQATAALGQVLSVIDPALGGLVDIDVLAKATSVRAEDGKNVADAAVTGLRIAITPPDLCALLSRLAGLTGVGDTIGGLLTSLAQPLPALPVPVAEVLGDLGSTLSCTVTGGGTSVLSALTQPLSVDVLSVSGHGEFKAAEITRSGGSGSTPTTPLASTGAEMPLLLLGAVLVAALAARRLLVRAS